MWNKQANMAQSQVRLKLEERPKWQEFHFSTKIINKLQLTGFKFSRLLLSCKWYQTAKWNCFGEACAQQTYFRSSLLSLRKIWREATTGNTSAVRRLKAGLKQTNFDIFKFILGSKDWGNKAKKCVIHCWASRWLLFLCLGASKLKTYFKIHQNWFVAQNSPIVHFETTTTLSLRNLKIERFRMSSRRPSSCPKTVKRRPC